ncbi:MAG: transcriptional regulator, partial [Mesorhizobium sp.]
HAAFLRAILDEAEQAGKRVQRRTRQRPL